MQVDKRGMTQLKLGRNRKMTITDKAEKIKETDRTELIYCSLLISYSKNIPADTGY